MVLDAMLQAVLIFGTRDAVLSYKQPRLRVPVKIGHFMWHCNGNDGGVVVGGHMYIKVFINVLEGTNPVTARLLGSTGVVIATMSAVEFVEMTARTIEAVIQGQQCGNREKMPDMWEVFWKPEELNAGRNLLEGDKASTFWKEMQFSSTPDKSVPPEVAEIHGETEDLVYLHLLNTLYLMGWDPKIGEEYESEQMLTDLGFAGDHLNYFGFTMDFLTRRGNLSVHYRYSRTCWKVESCPTWTQVRETLNSPTYTHFLETPGRHRQLIARVGHNLKDILQAKKSALDVFFSKNPADVDLEMFYEESAALYGFTQITSNFAQSVVSHYHSRRENDPCIHRILEVGAGTGAYTSIFLEALETLGVKYQYTFSDISVAFFGAAGKKFERFAKNMKYLPLDLDKDPLEQEGFTPHYYDICLAFQVVHSTKDVDKTLQHLRMLLKPGGALNLGETTRKDAYPLIFLFGLLPGYWKKGAQNEPPSLCLLNEEKWRKILNRNDFLVDHVVSSHFSMYTLICCRAKYHFNRGNKPDGGKTWLIFEDDRVCGHLKERMRALGRHVISVKRDLRSLHSKEDMSRRLSQVTAEGGDLATLEGIVYGWSLDSRSATQDDILGPFFQLTKNLICLTDQQGIVPQRKIRLLALTSGQVSVQEGSTISNCEASTLFGYFRSFMNECTGSRFNGCCVDLGSTTDPETIVPLVLYEMFHKIEPFLQAAYHNGVRHTLKMKRFQEKSRKDEDLQLSQNYPRFQLALPESRSLSELNFEATVPGTIEEDQVEIGIQFSALNFRDVLSVLKPTEQFHHVNSVGMDFCGEVVKRGENVSKWQVGDLVYGANLRKAAPPLPSHVVVNQDLVIRVPPNVTLAEAVTLPVVFATAYKCLFDVARLTATDKILIHTASGGVGLVAIQLCKSKIPLQNIFVTAGTPRKRAYLQNLGVQHVFNSRDTSYSQNILKNTNGEGVTVVLNSLTSPGFKEATLACCGKEARFVEMSKLSVWTGEEVAARRPDVEYTIFQVIDDTPEEIGDVMSKLGQALEEGVVKPLPYVRFDAVKIREAMQYLQKSRHIGKVMIAMPDRKRRGTGRWANCAPLFNDRSTYFITGGLGGLGFEVCKWMVGKQGAKYVLLGGRQPPKPEMEVEINKLNRRYDAHIRPCPMNVASFAEVKDLLWRILPEMGLPPLRGVMHAAGTLADGAVGKQEWSKFSSVFPAKIDGIRNLHDVTKSWNLEHFVLFSSFAAVLGPQGQANHAAANQFLDTWAHYRHSMGLAATTINWGQWCQVGVATMADFHGSRSITNEQGIRALEYILRTNALHVVVTNINDYDAVAKQFPTLKTLLDPSAVNAERHFGKNKKVFHILPSSLEFWKGYKKADGDAKKDLVKQHVYGVLGHVMNLPVNVDSSLMGEFATFESMGVDSLMFIEIKNELQNVLSSRVAVTEALIRQHNTVALLTEFVMDQLEGSKDDEQVEEIPNLE